MGWPSGASSPTTPGFWCASPTTPGCELRDIATTLGITERTAYGIVTALTGPGYIVKAKDGRRTRDHVQGHLPLREANSRERTIGEVLDLLVDTNRDTRTRRRGNTRGQRRTAMPRFR